MKRAISLLGLLASAAAPAANAQVTDAAATLFGALDDISQVTMAPDGSTLAIVRNLAGDRTGLTIVPATGGTERQLVATPPNQRLENCKWPKAATIICQARSHRLMGGRAVSYSQPYAFNVADGQVRLLTPDLPSNMVGMSSLGGTLIDTLRNKPRAVLMSSSKVPTAATRVVRSVNTAHLGVEEVDLETLKRTSVEEPRPGARSYLTDDMGNVRIMATTGRDAAGYRTPGIAYLYRLSGKSEWRPLSQLVERDGVYLGFNPIFIDPARNRAIGVDYVDGHEALLSLSLDGSMAKDVLLAPRDADIDGIISGSVKSTLIAATMWRDFAEETYLDPHYARLMAGVRSALPKYPAVSLREVSGDGGKMLVLARGDRAPGEYLLYDNASKRLDPIVAVRTALDGAALSEVASIKIPAPEGHSLAAYLTLPQPSPTKSLPAIVMARATFGERASREFDWWAQYFAARGYAVLQVNVRGTPGYGQAWAAYTAYSAWRAEVDDLVTAARWLTANNIAVPGKLSVAGWGSAGGAALKAIAVAPDLFRAAIAIGALTDWDGIRRGALKGPNGAIVAGMIDAEKARSNGAPLASIDQIKGPVLLFHAELDNAFPVEESRTFAAALTAAGRSVTLVTYPNVDRQFQASSARIDMLAKSDAFPRRWLKM